MVEQRGLLFLCHVDPVVRKLSLELLKVVASFSKFPVSFFYYFYFIFYFINNFSLVEKSNLIFSFKGRWRN